MAALCVLFVLIFCSVRCSLCFAPGRAVPVSRRAAPSWKRTRCAADVGGVEGEPGSSSVWRASESDVAWSTIYPNLGTLIPDGPKIVQPKEKDAIGTSLESSIDAILEDIRQQLYDTLLPLDRGDFRYEFLVPWVEEGSLSRSDKLVITVTFFALSFALQLAFEGSRGASVGVHASLIVQFFSYAVGNPIFFRLLAIVASLLDILGNLLEGQEQGLFALNLFGDWQQGWWDPELGTEEVFPVAYDFLFLVINGYYAILWCLGNDAFAAPNFTAEQEEVFTQSFGPLGIRRAQYARLLKSATFEAGAAAGGTTLCTEGKKLTELFVPLEPVEVRVQGVVTATLEPYRLVGEAALLVCLSCEEGKAVLPSRATIVAPSGARFVRIPHRAFYELLKEEGSDFSANVQIMIARTLSDKLKLARLESREAAVELDAFKDSVFAELDKNNDGVIDRREFRSFLAPSDAGSTNAEFVSEIVSLRAELKEVRLGSSALRAELRKTRQDLRACKDGMV